MFPILISIGPFPIHSYGFFIALGYLATMFLCVQMAKQRQMDPSPFYSLCFNGLIWGLIGARALYVVTEWSFYRNHPAEILQFWHGGTVFYGGFIFGFVGLVFQMRWQKLPSMAIFDIGAIAGAIGQAFGRLGCFAAGCCHGSLCDLPWAVHMDTDLVEESLRGKPIHPTQIYESLGLVILSAILYLAWRRRPKDGSVFLGYCTGYALLRFVVEIFRGDSIRGFWYQGGLSTSQGIALLIFIASAFAWVLLLFGRRTVRSGTQNL